MMVFVSGAVRSGKSAFGERLVLSHGGRPIYLATSQVYDGEMAQRIEHHRQSRAGKGFVTLEQHQNIGSVTAKLMPNDAVLLDCLGTLAANEMFGKPDAEEITGSMDVLYDKILSGVGRIKDSVSMLVVISNELFSDGIIYDGMTESYLHLMGRMHCALVTRAEVAVECANGCHIIHKGIISI